MIVRIGFVSNFLLKIRVLYLTILKRKKIKLTFVVETKQSVICLILLKCLSAKFVAFQTFHPRKSEANRDGADVESPFPLFFSFSASFKNSSRKIVFVSV